MKQYFLHNTTENWIEKQKSDQFWFFWYGLIGSKYSNLRLTPLLWSFKHKYIILPINTNSGHVLTAFLELIKDFFKLIFCIYLGVIFVLFFISKIALFHIYTKFFTWSTGECPHTNAQPWMCLRRSLFRWFQNLTVSQDSQIYHY